MKTAIIVHGAPSQEESFDEGSPSASNHHWLPWLQKQLIVRDYAAQTPEMPYAWEPQYSIWKREFERFDVNEQSILVGHSCGGGFLVRWMSEHPQVRVGRLALVAPWLDPDRTRTTDFFDFTIDPNLASRTTGLILFNSDDDIESIHASVELILSTVHHIQYREFQSYGHFCIEDMDTIEFPELLEAITI